ncbi:MAG: hypothetical protein Sapg2KO_04070 [Saprospiraceae bacterium]
MKINVEDEIKTIVAENLLKSLLGQSVERPNLDFKREWPDLSSKGKGYYEFLKDTCSIANTVSDKYGLIVYGYDDKSKKFKPSKFSDCGLRDSSDLYNLLNKNITENFQIEIYAIDYKNNPVNVLLIERSLARPHVIKEYKKIKNKNGEQLETIYENYIPVRKETGTFPATKYDLDLMYYDRKNLVFDKRIFGKILSATLYEFRGFTVILTIENLGIRHVAFRNFHLVISPNNGKKQQLEALSFTNLEDDLTINPGDRNLKITPNSISDIQLIFSGYLGENKVTNLVRDNSFECSILGEDIDGKKYYWSFRDIVFLNDDVNDGIHVL